MHPQNENAGAHRARTLADVIHRQQVPQPCVGLPGAVTSPVRQRATRALAWLEELASRRFGVIVLFALGLAVYAVQAIGWPLITGKDLDQYLLDYVQFLDWHPLLPWSMLFRTPIPGVIDGAALDVADGKLAEPVMAVLFAGSVVAWAVAARAFGARASILVAVAMLVFPAYGLLFHELSSDAIFAAGFALFVLLFVRAVEQPSLRRFAWAGLGVAVVALIRPGNAILIALVLFVFAVPGTWRQRLPLAASFAVAAIVPMVAWAVLNGVRFGDYTLARGGNAIVPFYRTFVSDKIVSPSNGPASRELARAVREHLLTRQPYKGYHVTLHEVFASGSFRIHTDLYNLSDQVFGWKSSYSVLRRAGIEAIDAHPRKYARGVGHTIWRELSNTYFRTPPARTSVSEASPTVAKSARRLPAPTEGQPIPGGQVEWTSRPDHDIRQVWTSPTQYHFAFRTQREKKHFEQIRADLRRLFSRLPTRKPNGQLLLRMNEASRWFPRSFLWIALGVIALLVRRTRGWPTLAVIAVAALLVIVFNALGQTADPRFALPVAPAFVFFGSAALLGPRMRR
jgi:Dolichyl-phosphate-mannose-protein mannosyltransferase